MSDRKNSAMKNKLTIVKLGGNCMDDEAMMANFIRQFVLLPGLKLLVHGGGKLASGIGSELGIQPKMIDGRRVTDQSTLDVVTMVYAGLINKKIVARLQAVNCNAIGLCGADGNVITAARRNPLPVDYGYVGDPISVNTSLLKSLLDNGLVPVIAPITHDAGGQLLNTNADTIAAVLAAALSAHYEVHLVFAFDKKGVLSDADDDESVITRLSKLQLNEMLAAGTVHSGMLPKLKAGFQALEKNVSSVALTHLHALQDPVHTELVL